MAATESMTSIVAVDFLSDKQEKRFFYLSLHPDKKRNYMQDSDNMAHPLPGLKGLMSEHLGIRFMTVEEGKVIATMPVDHRTCQQFGILNGGASLALAETVAGHGSILLCTHNEMPCGIQVSANHVRMVKVEEGAYVKATGTLIHRGRTTHIWNIDITNPEGKLISTARVVNQIVKRRI